MNKMILSAMAALLLSLTTLSASACCPCSADFIEPDETDYYRIFYPTELDWHYV